MSDIRHVWGTPNTMFENVKGKRLFEKIVDQIKDAVFSGTLKVGENLPSEHELAQIFWDERDCCEGGPQDSETIRTGAY